jgi:hypothetical protein
MDLIGIIIADFMDQMLILGLYCHPHAILQWMRILIDIVVAEKVHISAILNPVHLA